LACLGTPTWSTGRDRYAAQICAAPVAHTKDRGEVRGGGKKPWAQKGTGRARHGSSRSPIWKGGGITHGPRNDKSYAQKVNRQARQKALLVALSRKFKDGEILFIDSLEMANPKTKDAKAVPDRTLNPPWWL
jgi:large subunit ribosomal protein L4